MHFHGGRASSPLIAVVVALLLHGCSHKRQIDGETLPEPDKPYAAGAAGLKALWSDILVAAQHDEREKVHNLLASMIMTDDDLKAVFGPEKAAYLKPRYVPMVSRFVNIGAMELVAQIADRKYDDVEVFPVAADSPDPKDRATLAAAPHFPIFAARVKKKDEKLGLRYDFFVYLEGHWITGNQIATYLLTDRLTDKLTDGNKAPQSSPAAPATPPIAAPTSPPNEHAPTTPPIGSPALSPATPARP